MPDRTPTGLPYPTPTDQVAGLPATFRELVELIATNVQPTGTVAPFAGATAPDGWLICDGTDYARADYPALFATIGIAFTPEAVEQGGSRFRVPDLRGRMVIGAGAGSGLTARTRGDRGGLEAVALSIAQLPSHSHGGATGTDYPDHSHGSPNGMRFAYHHDTLTSQGTVNPVGAVSSADWSTGGANQRHQHAIPAEGGGQAHDNMPPWAALAYIIRT